MRRIIIISLLIMPLAMTEAFADVVVIVRREAEAAGNYIRVCDIARVEGPKEQVSEVALTVLGPTPPRGRPMEITRWDIESRLHEMGLGLNVTFSGNDTVRVSGNGLGGGRVHAGAVTPESLSPRAFPPGEALRLGGGSEEPRRKPAAPASHAVRKEPSASPLEVMPEDARARVGLVVSQYLAGRYSRNDVEVESQLLSLAEAIPYSAHEVAVEEATGGQVPGKATLALRVRDTPEAQPRRVAVSAETQVFALAPVAAKQLRKGDVLSSRDVVVKRVRMRSGQGYLPPNPKSVEGLELMRPLLPGEPVLAGETAPTQAVKRGDIVENIASSRGWKVQSFGKALGGGMVGDVIAIEDSANKTKYDARILARGVVSVIPRKKN